MQMLAVTQWHPVILLNLVCLLGWFGSAMPGFVPVARCGAKHSRTIRECITLCCSTWCPGFSSSAWPTLPLDLETFENFWTVEYQWLYQVNPHSQFVFQPFLCTVRLLKFDFSAMFSHCHSVFTRLDIQSLQDLTPTGGSHQERPTWMATSMQRCSRHWRIRQC